jgi:hypothetical protein
MAWYKSGEFLKKSDNAAYDTDHKPGDATPFSGIYRCMACGHEIVSEQHKPFPPQNHHQHAPPQPIRWRLIVYADHESK